MTTQEAFTPTVEGERRRFERMTLDERVAAVVAASLLRLSERMAEIFPAEAKRLDVVEFLSDDALVEIMARAITTSLAHQDGYDGDEPWPLDADGTIAFLDQQSPNMLTAARAALNALREHGKEMG